MLKRRLQESVDLGAIHHSFAMGKRLNMDASFVVEFKGDYIHAVQHGVTGYSVSLELWQQIVAACEEHDCFNILGESSLSGTLDTMDGYDHADIFRMVGITWKHRIAWVNHNQAHAEWFRFIESVLKNRGLANGHIFPTVEEAKQWLLSEKQRPPT